MNSSISSFGIYREAWYATGTEQQVTQISLRSCPAKRRDDNNGTVFCCIHRFILRGTSAHTLYTAPIHDVVKLMAISSYRKRSRTASACVQRQHRSVGPMACANGCDDNDRRKSTENDHVTNAITIAVGASALATTDGKNGENCKPVVPTSTVGCENFKAKEAAPWRKMLWQNAATQRKIGGEGGPEVSLLNPKERTWERVRKYRRKALKKNEVNWEMDGWTMIVLRGLRVSERSLGISERSSSNDRHSALRTLSILVFIGSAYHCCRYRASHNYSGGFCVYAATEAASTVDR